MGEEERLRLKTSQGARFFFDVFHLGECGTIILGSLREHRNPPRRTRRGLGGSGGEFRFANQYNFGCV